MKHMHTMHYKVVLDVCNLTACNQGFAGSANATSNVRNVTCGNCKRTKVYRQALLDELPGKEKPAPKAGSEEIKGPLEFSRDVKISCKTFDECAEEILKILEDLIENGASE